MLSAVCPSSSSSSSGNGFDSLAESWWQPDGDFSMLHRMQPARMRYLREQLIRHNLTPDRSALKGKQNQRLQVLDIGCGGGLMSEPLTRLGAEVTAIDSSAPALLVARRHAEERGLSIDYRNCALEDMSEEKTFDLLCAMEIIEHVPDPQRFLDKAARLLKEEGLLLLSTLNRTVESWVKGILIAERLLGLVPRETHEWRKFLTPEELARLSKVAGLEVCDLCGMRYRVGRGDFSLVPTSLSFNYIACLRKER